MPATVIDEPLAVLFVLDDGSRWTAALDGLPNPALARDLAQGMAANARPHGGIGAMSTAEDYAVGLRQMVIKLSEAGFTGTAAELTRPKLVQLWMASSWINESRQRLTLKGFDSVTGALDPEVRAYLTGRQVQTRKATHQYQAYTDGEWERLEAACRKVVDESWSQQKGMLSAAGEGADPRVSRVHSEANIAWLMLREGPLTFEGGYRELFHGSRSADSTENFHRNVGKRVTKVRDGLFPTRHVQIAHALLFGVYTGVVPDGINDLGLGDVEWTGDASALLTYFKGRTSRESVSISRQAVRLLERWLEVSSELRRLAPAELQGQLWISASTSGVVGPPPKSTIQNKFGLAQGLVGDAGTPLPIHRGRIRATYNERLARRGWTGRVTIDPNHSARTEGDHYVTPTNPAQLDAIESVIEDGQADVMRKSLTPVVLSSEKAAAFAEGFPEEVKRLGLDTAAIAELVGGERDVFTAACADQLAGVHGPAGQPCPARPWVCLLCPLAVFMPRHAANLLRLNAYFSRQFLQMPTENFLRVFGPYADRLNNEILPKFSDGAKAEGELEVSNDDSELPLRPEEGTL